MTNTDESSDPQLIVPYTSPPAVPHLFALGIPKGEMRDPAGSERAGVVSRGGELVTSITPEDYRLWLLFIQPQKDKASALAAATQFGVPDAARSFDALEKNGLLTTITPGSALTEEAGQLRPIPLGMGLGNTTSDDPDRYAIGAGPGQPAIYLGGLGLALWLQCSGVESLKTLATNAARYVGQPVSELEGAVTELLYAAMTCGLMYLDVVGAKGG